VWAVDIPADQYDSDGDLKIYDDCNAIRRKINAFLKKYAAEGVTQTALLKLLNVNSNSLGRFMKLKGVTKGAENGAYSKAYEFFEKLRILEKKPKSASRLKAEKEYSLGYEKKDVSRMGFWLPPGVEPPTLEEVMKQRAVNRD